MTSLKGPLPSLFISLRQERPFDPAITPLSHRQNVETNFPQNLSFSGSSGGALVATALGTGLNVRDVFEMVVAWPGTVSNILTTIC